MNDFWRQYYASLEGATILKFVGMKLDEFNPHGDGFPAFLVKFESGEKGVIEISQDPEGNGGGFIFGLKVPQQ